MFFPRRGRPPGGADGTPSPIGPANDPAGGAGVPSAGIEALRGALLESRLRWQDFASLGADFAFETDRAGAFTFVSPNTALGFGAGSLIGTKAADLLTDRGDGFDPFALQVAARGRRAWVRHAGGHSLCLSFAAAPLWDAHGRVCGTRGVATDVTEQDRRDRATAVALRRAETMEHLFNCVRTELLAADGMRCLLGALVASEGAAGAAVLRLHAPDAGLTGFDVLHASVSDVGPIAGEALSMVRALAASAAAPDGVGRAASAVCGNRTVLAGHVLTPFAEDTILLLWREAEGRAFDPEDERTIAGVMAVVRVVLEHEMVQRQLAACTRTDPLTGALHAAAFAQELPRYIDRLDRDGEPGTAMHVDLDQFSAVNQAHGYAVGDAVLTRMAKLLCDTVRPTDVVARLGGNLFAIWLQGADHLTAAERAERLRTETPAILREVLVDGRARSLSVSIGIASRRAGSEETAEEVMARAAAMLADVKANGAAHWRVAPAPLGPAA